MPNSMINPELSQLLRDMDELISKKISADEFETRFIARNSLMRLETLDGQRFGYETYQNLFYAIDDYVSNPDLRTGSEDLDDDQLIGAVSAARQKFTQELAALGFDKYGHPVSQP
jgi:hypothetical protein